MESSRFRRLVDNVLGVGFIQEGAVPLASVVMSEGEPFRYAVSDLAGYGLEVYTGTEQPEKVVEFERDGVKGVGFVQTNTGTEIAAIAWPEGDPKRYPVIDLAGVRVLIVSSSVSEEKGWDHSAESIEIKPDGVVVIGDLVVQAPCGSGIDLDKPYSEQVAVPVVDPTPAIPVPAVAPAVAETAEAAPIEPPAKVVVPSEQAPAPEAT